MNIRYPIYEGVYRILTIVFGDILFSIFEYSFECLYWSNFGSEVLPPK